MAFQTGSVCYSTALEAAQSQASSMVGTVIDHGSIAHVVDVGVVTSSSITYLLYPFRNGNGNSASSPVSLVAPFTPQPCNLLQWSDGLQLGWMVAAVWISVYALIFIAKTFSGWESPQNDA